MSRQILILGASARAAAFSALRSGYKPVCADFFADQDLAAVCLANRVSHRNRRRQFTAVADRSDAPCWFYTGGFEHHPELVDQISRKHHLWGMNGETLRAVRDPFRVAEALRQVEIPCPAVKRNARGLNCDGSWLTKPFQSGGGIGIEPLVETTRGNTGRRYFQQRIRGPSFSALYLGVPPTAHLVGITRQLIGVPANPFAYRGSIGPLPASASLSTRLVALGSRLTATFGLTGWFGIDYVLNRGIPWPVELNPRYTASVEIHELALGRSLLEVHQRACDGIARESDFPVIGSKPTSAVFGKLIVYARTRGVVPESLRLREEALDLYATNAIADVPWPGSAINTGEPVLTLLASAATAWECARELIRRERKLLRRMRPAIEPNPAPRRRNSQGG